MADLRRPPPSARLEAAGDLVRPLVHGDDLRPLALRVRGEHTLSPGHARWSWADTPRSDGHVLVGCPTPATFRWSGHPDSASRTSAGTRGTVSLAPPEFARHLGRHPLRPRHGGFLHTRRNPARLQHYR